MKRRGCELNWFFFMRDVASFHESEFCASIQLAKDSAELKSGIGRLDGCMLYTLVRWTRPVVLVETGTYNGFSTAYILKALKDNGQPARLYSIDRDQSVDLTPLISAEDQSRYLERIEGSSLEVCKSKAFPKAIDFFFHDSVHRHDHQLSEFRVFWPLINPGGVLASHDVPMNSSFPEFCSETYAHDERGYAKDEGTTHSFWGVLASSGFIQKRR